MLNPYHSFTKLYCFLTLRNTSLPYEIYLAVEHINSVKL
jgi:hypothetical protein